jgi:hypothetical protein
MALVASLLLPLAAFIGAARAADTSPIVMATDREDSVFTGKWFRRIYVEAFRRMDVPLKITVLPLARISSELDAGHLDGEMLRVLGYAAAHPELVRVEESVLEVGLVLYGANPALRINRVEDIAAAPSLNGEFRHHQPKGSGWKTDRRFTRNSQRYVVGPQDAGEQWCFTHGCDLRRSSPRKRAGCHSQPN